jgi:hypothetical protein
MPQDLVRLGEAASLVLREDQRAVAPHVEDAVVALDQPGLAPGRLLDRGRQPGGLGQEVSAHAVFDADLHVDLPVRAQGWQLGRGGAKRW